MPFELLQFVHIIIAVVAIAVFVALRGLEFVPKERFERFVPALAGASVFFCGLAIQLGL